MFSSISFIQIKNNNGASIDPWGTPAFVCLVSETIPVITTLWFRPAR